MTFDADLIRDASDELFLTRNIPMLSRYFDFLGLVTRKNSYIIKENSDLTQIYLPSNKIDTLVQWYNETIRFETDIPSAFLEGYIIIENKFVNKNYDDYRRIIKAIAKVSNQPFYEVKHLFMNLFLNQIFKTCIYFKFKDQNKIKLEVYDYKTKEIMHIINFEIGKDSGIEPIITSFDVDDFINCENRSEMYDDIISKFYAGIFATIMWYITTNTNNTKYVYTETKPRYNYEVKHVINPKDVKMITRTIYDLNKVKTINIDTLNKRKAGWTYSHSFEVHGHYRHYKNGKTIFIKPFIKGKEKILKAQKIILDPKNEMIGGD